MSGEIAPRSTTKRRRRANVPGGRTHKHEVWVSGDEEGALLSRANAAGMTVPRYLMERGLSDEGGETITERRERLGELLRLRRLLAADSNNLNQLTRVVNSGQPVSTVSEKIAHTLIAVDAILDRLDALLKEEARRP